MNYKNNFKARYKNIDTSLKCQFDLNLQIENSVSYSRVILSRKTRKSHEDPFDLVTEFIL